MNENPYKAPIEGAPKQWIWAWRALFVLGILLALAPIFGLLMTAFGMVSAFEQIAASQGQPQPKDLAAGIQHATVPAAIGFLACPVGIVVTIVSAIKLVRRKPPA